MPPPHSVKYLWLPHTLLGDQIDDSSSQHNHLGCAKPNLDPSHWRDLFHLIHTLPPLQSNVQDGEGPYAWVLLTWLWLVYCDCLLLVKHLDCCSNFLFCYKWYSEKHFGCSFKKLICIKYEPNMETCKNREMRKTSHVHPTISILIYFLQAHVWMCVYI